MRVFNKHQKTMITYIPTGTITNIPPPAKKSERKTTKTEAARVLWNLLGDANAVRVYHSKKLCKWLNFIYEIFCFHVNEKSEAE